MAGMVIPENVFSKKDYNAVIFEPINKAIKPFDTDNILEHHFLNSRGAIARFDRNAIEIRLVDIQECPKADIGICVLIIEVLKLLVNEKLTRISEQKKWQKEDLFAILNATIKEGENYTIVNSDYLELFDLENSISVKKVWQHLYRLAKPSIHKSHHEALDIVLEKGTLSTRILNALKDDFSEENIKKIYKNLSDCLENNTLFL
jgi:hypothetical protein